MLNRKEVQFDKLLDRATSNLLLEPDWNLNIQVCDLIRQKDVRLKHAVDAIRKKFKSENPNVLYFTLLVLEACMKNCGDPFHAEIATKSFMTELHGILQVSTAEKVRRKIIELIQTWEFAFRNQPKCRAVGDLLAIVKMEGYKLPEFVESDKMYAASVAPQIIDADYCYRCRITFSLLQRKMPCANCGHTFCGQCTSHKMPLPHFGIEKLVPVCEACWHSLRKPPLPPKPQFPTQEKSAAATLKSAGQADEELKRAIELSIQEEETKKAVMREADKELELAVRLSKQEEMKKYKGHPKEDTTALCMTTPELIRYLDRQYWERRSEKLSPEKITRPLQRKTKNIKVKNATVTDKLDNFAGELKNTLQGFVNRLQSDANRGRSIIDDTYVQSLFGKISAMNYQLISYLEELSTTRTYYESLQDKIYQLQDGAAAFRALRNEHSKRQIQLAKKEKFLRDIQMAQKVREVRKQKQEILQAEARKTLLQLQKTKKEMLLKTDKSSLDVPPPLAPLATGNAVSMQPTCPSYPYNPFYADESSNVASPATPMAQGIRDPDSAAILPPGNVFLPESYSGSETSTTHASKPPPCSMDQISTRKSGSEDKKQQSTHTKGKPNT